MKISKLYILYCLLIALPFSTSFAEQKKDSVNKDLIARKKITELEILVKTQSEQLKLLKTDLNTGLNKQEAQAQELNKATNTQNTQIDDLKKQNAYNSMLSSEGAIILLVGLLIEILGALLLGAPVLATKIEELSDFEIDPGLDMALHAPKKEAVLAFYSMVGNIFLFLGFTAQFAGTALVLSVDWKSQLLIVLGGLVFGFLILFWLLGIDPTQSRKQKLVVVWKNIVRVSKIKTSQALFRGKACEVCLKKVNKNDPYISWYDEGNSDSHPYLHRPNKFLVGHSNCLKQNVKDRIEAHANIEARAKIKPHYHLLEGRTFVSTRFEKYKQWFTGYYENWSKIRSDTRRPALQEVELDAAVTRINKINS